MRDNRRMVRMASLALYAAFAALGAALHADYARTHRYDASPPLLDGVVSALPEPGVVHRGRALRVTTRSLRAMRGPQVDAIAGDLPGTIYVSVSSDEQRASL